MIDHMRLRYWTCFVVATVSVAAPAGAADMCKAVAITATPAVEAPDAVDAGKIVSGMPRLAAGTTIVGVTQYDVGPSTGERVYCVHGGGCYPARSLKLLDCTIGPAETAQSDSHEIVHPLVIARSKFTALQLEQDDTDDRLVKLGVASAQAYTAASDYVAHPDSRCAETVGKALHGDSSAIATINDGDVCR